MNKKLMLVAKACLLSLLASSGSAPAAAAAGAGAGVRGKAADYKSERENKEPYSFKIGKGIASLAYSPDGNRLAIANQDTDEVRVFNVDRSTGALQEIGGSPFSVKNPSSIVYSPDGKWLAVTTDRGLISPLVHNLTVFKVDETTGALRSIAGSPFETDTGAVKARYSPDGNWLAVAQLQKNSLTILKVDNATGQLQKVNGSPFKIDSLGDGWVWALAYSPDGNWLASAGNDCSERPNSLTMFKVNKNTGALEKVEGSPFDRGCINLHSLVFSPDGKRLAAGGDILTVFNVDERSGVLRQVNGASFFKPAKGWFNSIIYSPDGNWLAAVSYEKDSLMVFKVDKVTGQLKKVNGSPFNTGSSPSSIAYSPDGSCLALGDEKDGVVRIYEVDQETGALSPITGGILTHIKRYQEAERVLTNKESISESVMPKDVLGVLHEYIVGPRAKPSNDLPKTTAGAMQGDIDLARKQQKDSHEQVAQLFAAIKEGSVSEIDRLLTPFTINARDNEYNTPLIMAASHQRDAIVQKILAYEGKIQRDEYHADIVRADLKAINSAKNSALKLALVHNNYAIARMIVQEMYDRHSKDTKEPYLSVYERNKALAMVLMAVDQNNVDVIRLIELLQKD